MKFACATCMYTYDESIGEPALQIDAGTPFDELGEEFYCPQCTAEKERFSLLEQEVNYPLDYEDLTDLESEHYPILIDKDDDWIKLQIGEKVHQSNDDHYITSVTLYDEYEEVIDDRILLSTEEPIIEFDIDISEVLEIRVSCSVHGLWGRKLQDGK